MGCHGALLQPIWRNAHIPPPNIRAHVGKGKTVGIPKYQRCPQRLLKDGAFMTPYKKTECSAYLEHLPYEFVHEGRTIRKGEFVDSWDEVVSSPRNTHPWTSVGSPAAGHQGRRIFSLSQGTTLGGTSPRGV
eukprot:scaffold89358_cov35-Tisochrysis_lutea.AAC.3